MQSFVKIVPSEVLNIYIYMCNETVTSVSDKCLKKGLALDYSHKLKWMKAYTSVDVPLVFVYTRNSGHVFFNTVTYNKSI